MRERVVDVRPFSELDTERERGAALRIVFVKGRVYGQFICGKNPDREVGDEELPESSWLGMVRG